MKKNPGFKALGHAVITLPDMAEVKKSRIVMPDQVSERLELIEVRALVIDVGPECWKDEREARCAVGDTVMLARMSGTMVTGADGVKYRVVNDRDIFLKFDARSAAEVAA